MAKQRKHKKDLFRKISQQRLNKLMQSGRKKINPPKEIKEVKFNSEIDLAPERKEPDLQSYHDRLRNAKKNVKAYKGIPNMSKKFNHHYILRAPKLIKNEAAKPQ